MQGVKVGRMPNRFLSLFITMGDHCTRNTHVTPLNIKVKRSFKGSIFLKLNSETVKKSHLLVFSVW